MSHLLEIEYCRMCRWTLRAFWLAQELLQTFEEDFSEVRMLPNTGGHFKVRVDGQEIWCRKADHGFPEPKVLKQRVRQVIDPERDLGHIDRDHANDTAANASPN
ncbi:MAG TPA: SelT/SelW/SelH family protein [Oligoflexus sp.]|uniref:SelT/SelW/SelH family protein n=1 Tax=Oligoflexus sp. TaxID=1971216 RepID=UPI002D55A93E|nr:SelT/SelW/SelH family protein [Oligoflexus sp.]HYX35008.1 SelT/SelW/SelH family protein [Oligoflexus sp.]